MNENYVFIGRWLYDKPALSPDTDGNIVLISKQSFGPLETYEWGIDSNNNPYKCYEWLENDWFEDLSHRKNITKQELLDEIGAVIKIFNDNGLVEWSRILDSALDSLNL